MLKLIKVDILNAPGPACSFKSMTKFSEMIVIRNTMILILTTWFEIDVDIIFY